jgi:hypothetical protein
MTFLASLTLIASDLYILLINLQLRNLVTGLGMRYLSKNLVVEMTPEIVFDMFIF